jgi:hypothetical protein
MQKSSLKFHLNVANLVGLGMAVSYRKNWKGPVVMYDDFRPLVFLFNVKYV